MDNSQQMGNEALNQAQLEKMYNSLGLWCGAQLEYIQEEMNTEVCPSRAFRETGKDLYEALLERGWTPPPPK